MRRYREQSSQSSTIAPVGRRATVPVAAEPSAETGGDAETQTPPAKPYRLLPVIAALIGNAVIACAKFAAAFLTGSGAMTSEAIHSVVDTCNQALLIFGDWRSRRPP
ncbi:MAG: cation transporter [bacterium]